MKETIQNYEKSIQAETKQIKKDDKKNYFLSNARFLKFKLYHYWQLTKILTNQINSKNFESTK